MLSPWLLASQRGHDEQRRKQLQATEAKHAMQLAEAARSLLSLQHSTQQLETQIAQITDVYHVTKETARSLHFSELFAASLDTAPRLLNARGLRLIDLSGPTPQVLRATRTTDGRMVAGESNHTLLDMEQAIIKEIGSAKRSSSGTARELTSHLPEGL